MTRDKDKAILRSDLTSDSRVAATADVIRDSHSDPTTVDVRPGAGTKPIREKASAEVTYIPGDGDPHRVTWGGLEFKAYVPTKVGVTHAISVPLRKEHVLADGTVQSRNVETRVSLVELARGNPSFAVDGVRTERKVGTARVPSSNDEYRGYAIAWIAASTAAQPMDTRWDAEADLRGNCGVDDKDIAYLRPFFEARRDQVKAAEIGQVA